MTQFPALKGAPRSMTILDYGLFRVHQNGRVIGICGFLVETDADERVLIDSGFPPAYAEDAQAASAADGLGTFGEVLTLDRSNLPRGQLALLGLTPEDIDLFILSHGHIDHVGGIDGFPQAPIIVSRAERAMDRPSYFADRHPLTWPDRTYHLVEGDMSLGKGFEILLTPGHAPGQLAFWLTLPDTGPVLLTSDSISRPAEVDEAYQGGAWDAKQALFHARRILSRAEAENALVIYGHCPSQWPDLPKAPQRYG